MKINYISNINNFSNYSKAVKFGHTAVPYPEYEHIQTSNNQHDVFSIISHKISDFLHPEVSKQAKEIKSQIDSVFDANSVKGTRINSVA